MARSRKSKPKHEGHLDLTEDFVEQFVDNKLDEDLQRVGIVWSGIIGLDYPISASTVAALLSSYDLVLATALIDSERHWARAAAFAVLGNKSEPKQNDENDENEDSTVKASNDFKIGFGPSSQSHPSE
jgi:hypothetical protein